MTLPTHLDSFEEAYQKQSEEVVTNAGYGGKQDYEMLEQKVVTGYVKYNYFHQEQKKKVRNNLFLVQNLFYNAE
jgi:hypothetical protein